MSKKDRDLGVSDVIEILEWLEEANVDLWLDGGWGHDAVLGEQTRRHDDLDLLVHAEHSARLIDALEAHGFAVTERASPDAFVLEDGDGRQVDVHCARKTVRIGRSPRKGSKVGERSVTEACAA